MDVRDLWHRLMGYCYKHESMYLYCCDIAETLTSAPPLTPGLTACVYDQANLPQAKTTLNAFPRLIEQRVQRGDLALLAVQERQWIFRSSVVLGPKSYPVIGYPLHLGGADAYLECAETVASWRGKGVAPGMLGQTMKELQARGFVRAFMTIATTNASSCRAAEKGGAQRIGVIRARRLLGRWRASYEPLINDEQYSAVLSE